jgi:hypothetical protein
LTKRVLAYRQTSVLASYTVRHLNGIHDVATAQELKELAFLRMKEAETLFDAGLYDGAAYLCGYVVELALKARICKHLCLPEYPDSGTHKKFFAVHDFDHLLLLSGLKPEVSLTHDPELFNNWSVATPWNPERRYLPAGSTTKQEAQDLLDAIRANPKGLFPWIQIHW